MCIYVTQKYLFCILPVAIHRKSLYNACSLKIYMSPKMPSIASEPSIERQI